MADEGMGMSGEFSYAVEIPITQEGVARIIRRAQTRIVATWRVLSTGECEPEFNIDLQPPPPHSVVDEALRLCVASMPRSISVVPRLVSM